MKKLIAILFVAIALAGIGRAQTAVTTLVFVGTNPSFAEDGTLKSANIEAGFNSALTIDGKTYNSTARVNWDGTDATRTVTVDGVTATYAQVTKLAAEIAKRELAGAEGTQKKAAADKAAADAAAAKAAQDAPPAAPTTTTTTPSNP